MVVAISSDRSGPMKTVRISDAAHRAIAEVSMAEQKGTTVAV